MIRKFENGIIENSFSATTVFKLAKTLNVDFEYFYSDQVKEKVLQKRHYYLHENELIAKTPRFTKMDKLINFIRSTIDKENNWESNEIEDFIFLPAYLNVSFCFYMPDDSMAPMILKNDNICIFKTHTLNEKVPCLFLNKDRVFLRKWVKQAKNTKLIPVNSHYPEIVFNERSKEWQIIGISLYFWRDTRNAAGENQLLKTLDNVFPGAEIE